MQKQDNVFTLTELEERVEFGVCGGGGDGGGDGGDGSGCGSIGDQCERD